jgi:hypothetical protein
MYRKRFGSISTKLSDHNFEDRDLGRGGCLLFISVDMCPNYFYII